MSSFRLLPRTVQSGKEVPEKKRVRQIMQNLERLYLPLVFISV